MATVTGASEIVFVYNANRGVASALADLVHKIVSPSTYPCNLCAVTYSAVGMRRPWREFVRGLPLPVEFLHRDELRERYGESHAPLPAAFVRSGSTLEPWIDSAEMNGCRTLDDLITLVRGRLDTLPSPAA